MIGYIACVCWGLHMTEKPKYRLFVGKNGDEGLLKESGVNVDQPNHEKDRGCWVQEPPKPGVQHLQGSPARGRASFCALTALSLHEKSAPLSVHRKHGCLVCAPCTSTVSSLPSIVYTPHAKRSQNSSGGAAWARCPAYVD